MNTMQQYLPSLIRFTLSLAAGWLASHGISSFDLTSDSLMQIVTALVMIGLVMLLKMLDSGGIKNKLLKSIIGPRVENIAYSIARTIVAAISGATVGYIGMNEDTLANADLASILLVLGNLGLDYFTKKIKP